jgi:integrase
MRSPRSSSLVRDAVSSPLTRVMYARALNDFFGWWTGQGRPPFTRATVQAWRAALEAKGLAPASVNQKLSAIRKLATEAAYNGLLDPAAMQAIRDIRGAEQRGVRTGNWLTKRQAEALLAAPDPATNQGKRDRAILAVLVGCGLRRDEAVRLTFAHIQQRDGRWCVVDLVGKKGRYRTVPMPAWTKTAIDSWVTAASITAGPMFRGVNKGDAIAGERLSTQGIRRAVTRYADAIAPHDLRRTFAKLAFKGGAKLDQIQLSLGHASMQTTERYLGVQQDLTDALRLPASEGRVKCRSAPITANTTTLAGASFGSACWRRR